MTMLETRSQAMGMPPMARRLATGLTRIDGPAKVTGAATYAVEQQLEGLAHAVLVQSTIPAGTIRRIDTTKAQAYPGVLLVLTPDNIIMHLNTATSWPSTCRRRTSPIVRCAGTCCSAASMSPSASPKASSRRQQLRASCGSPTWHETPAIVRQLRMIPRPARAWRFPP